MAGRRAPRLLAISNTVYELLLRGCPAGYRREYGTPMAQAFRDLAREAYHQHGARGVVALWLRILPDTGATAIAEHVVALKERRAVANVQLATAGGEGGHTVRPALREGVGSAVSVGALVVGALSSWPLSILALLGLILRPLPGGPANPLAGIVTMPVAMWAFFASALVSDLRCYVALSGAGIALAAAALLFGPRRRVLVIAEALTLVATLALPWLWRYQAAVVPAPGEVVLVATQPGAIEGVVKTAQGMGEQVPSTYEILGWNAGGVLYYRETVTATQATRTWAYRPGKGAHAQLVVAPTGIVPTAESPRELLLERVRAQVYPQSAEPNTRPLHIREDGLASPDGRWAAVVAKHIYGPEDVIVIGLE